MFRCQDCSHSRDRQAGSLRPTRHIGVAFVVFGFLCLLASPSAAYEQYSVDGDFGNCAECHSNFRNAPYVSLSDGQLWLDGLHNTHRYDMLSGDCSVCHGSGPRFPVLLGSSAGGTGLPAISCAGCHGRADDGTGQGSVGYGAGLRQHHWNEGVTVCGDCHADSDPASFDPVGEDFLPPYYSDADAAHPLMPSDPCNPTPDLPEDYAGSTAGLDNDGDLAYDEADLIDCPEPGEALMLGFGIGALLLAGRVRARGGRA